MRVTRERLSLTMAQRRRAAGSLTVRVNGGGGESGIGGRMSIGPVVVMVQESRDE